MRFRLLFIAFLISHSFLFSGNDPSIKNETRPTKIVTKKRLVQLVDSILDLKIIGSKELEIINYYSSILKTHNKDSVALAELDLQSLSFYSAEDEKALFPPVSPSEIAAFTTLIIENGYLSYFTCPVSGVVTSHYGWREGRLHKGTDIDLEKGDKVQTAFAGKIRVAKSQGGYGNVVVVMHANGLETVYAHLSRIKVKAGDIVQSGQVIGLGGNTGHSSGSHLHFEVRYKGHALDPSTLISFREKKLFFHTVVIRNNLVSLSAFPANSNSHKVHRGETLFAIANKYGLSVPDLEKMNGISRKYSLKAGQTIKIK